MHIASSTIEYIPPPGPTGPTDISITAYIHNCLPGGGIYSNIGYVVYKVYLKKITTGPTDKGTTAYIHDCLASKSVSEN